MMAPYRAGFLRWISERLATKYPRLQCLQFRQTLYLKGKGLGRSAIDTLSRQTKYVDIL